MIEPTGPPRKEPEKLNMLIGEPGPRGPRGKRGRKGDKVNSHFYNYVDLRLISFSIRYTCR